MSKSSRAFKTIMPAAPALPKAAEEWIGLPTADVPEVKPSNVTTLPVASDAMKRFTIDVEEGLHKRIKAQCAMKGTKMADVIREMLEKAFPANA